MSISIRFSKTDRYRLFAASAALGLILCIAAQGFGTAQAERLGYVQGNCPNVVQQALDAVNAQCSKAGRGKVCYGNSSITAELQPGATGVTFNAPGDLADVSQIKSLTLGALDTTAKTWGVAELKIKADLSNTDVSQMVTMIMFGDTKLTDASSDANGDLLTQTPGAMTRESQYVTATARAIDQKATYAASTATKISAIEATNTARATTPTPTGTIPAYKMTYAAATATKLANIINTATAAPIPQTPIPGQIIGPYSGLQAFYFQSSDSAACAQAPHDGLLIQSPQGSKQRATLNIDGATISLGSTVQITAQASGFLTVNTLNGDALVTAFGQTSAAVAGTAVQVPLDANLHPSGPPVSIKTIFYAADTIRAAPVQILPVVIVPVPGISASARILNASLTVLPNSILSGNCYNHFADGYSDSIKLVVDDTLGRVWVPIYGGNFILSKGTDNVYHGTQAIAIYVGGSFDHYGSGNLSMTFSSPDHASGAVIGDFKDGCAITKNFTIDASANASLTSTSSNSIPGTNVSATPSVTLTRTPSNTPTPSRTKPPTVTPTPSRTKPPTLTPTVTP